MVSGWPSVCLAFVAASLLAMPQGKADAALEEAARHFEEGTRLYAAESYRAAIDEFEAAQAIAPAPANLFNLARCYEKLAEMSLALELFERYLADPAAPDRARVERRVADLRALPVELFVSTAPSGARVVVDGRDEAEPERTPSVVRLRPGRHRVRVEREGFVSVERSVELRSLVSGRLHLDLAVAGPVLDAGSDEDPIGVDPASVPSVLEEIRTRRDDRRVLWRLSVALGASKYDDTAFVVGLDGGPVFGNVLFNLHWLAMTSTFSGQVLGEVMWDVALDDLDLFVGLGAGAVQIRRNGEGVVDGILRTSTAAFVGEIVGGIDFFLRRQLALGITLRLQVPIDQGARDRAGRGDEEDPDLLILAAGHVALHL